MLFLFYKFKKIGAIAISFNFSILNFCLAFQCYPLYVPIITMQGVPITWLLHALTAWDLRFQVCLDKQVYEPTKAIVISLFYVCDSNQRA
jgi:hypothetical protein